jgi:hypothetical protein
MDSFLSLRLTGKRFEEHGVPLEFLRNLPALNELIVKIAEDKFQEEHPGEEAPKSLRQGFELRLTNIRAGSTALDIDLISFGNSDDSYSDAIQSLLDTINSLLGVEDRPGDVHIVPRMTASFFSRLGRTLRRGEAMELTTQFGESRLAQEDCRHLRDLTKYERAATEETETEQMWVCVQGSLRAVDQDAMTCEIQLLDGRRIQARIQPSNFEAVIQDWNEYGKDAQFEFSGMGWWSPGWHLQRLEVIEGFKHVGPLNFQAQVDSILALENGWLDGLGLAPPKPALRTFEDFFLTYYPDDLPVPSICPTEDGGVQLEWGYGIDHILTVDLSMLVADWVGVTEADDREQLDIRTRATWEFIASSIRQASDASK